MASLSPSLPKCGIFIDKEGNWFHEGRPIIRKSFILDAYRHMHRDEEGRYVLRWMGEECEVDVEDTPVVIQRVDRVTENGREFIHITLNDESVEPLDPDSLWIGEANVLYAQVRGGTFPARFLRPAYYQLVEHLEYDETARCYYLTLDGRKKRLPLPS